MWCLFLPLESLGSAGNERLKPTEPNSPTFANGWQIWATCPTSTAPLKQKKLEWATGPATAARTGHPASGTTSLKFVLARSSARYAGWVHANLTFTPGLRRGAIVFCPLRGLEQNLAVERATLL
jgi:hypothetical protein